MAGHGEGAPGVVDQSIDAETAQIQESLLPALLEFVAAAADEPATEPGRLETPQPHHGADQLGVAPINPAQIDPQQSAARWGDRRTAALPVVLTVPP